MDDDELFAQLRSALPDLGAQPTDLDRIRRGIRRQRQIWWGGAGAVATAALVAFAVVATGSGPGHSDTIVPPAVRPSPTTTVLTPPPTPSTRAPVVPTTPSSTQAPPQNPDLVAEVPFQVGSGYTKNPPNVANAGAVVLISGRSGATVRVLVPAPTELTAGGSPKYSYSVIGPPRSGFVYFNRVANVAQDPRVILMRVPITGGDAEVVLTPKTRPGLIAQSIVPSPDDSEFAVVAEEPAVTLPYISTVTIVTRDGATRAEFNAPTIAGWLDTHTLLTYYVQSSGAATSVTLARLDIHTKVSSNLAAVVLPRGTTGANIECYPSAAVGVSATGAIEVAIGGDNVAAECPIPIQLVSVDPTTGRQTRGTAAFSVRDGVGLGPDEVTLLPSGAFLLSLSHEDCYAAPRLLRIDGPTVTTLTPDEPTC